ncbi:MAG TPA: EF-hand domain-containing protein [Albitalea sp.]
MATLSSIARASLTAVLAGATFGALAQATSPAQTPAPQTQAPAANDPAAAGNSAATDAAFKRADTNGDGKLSSDEARQFPALAGKFTEFDKDADGALSSAEFAASVSGKN